MVFSTRQTHKLSQFNDAIAEGGLASYHLMMAELTLRHVYYWNRRNRRGKDTRKV